MPQQSPSVMTGSQASVLAALVAAMPPDKQAAAQQQLSVLSRKLGNKQYIRDALEKHAMSLTNGAPSQAYSLNAAMTFNLPQPNNAFARGVFVYTSLNYTIGTAAVTLNAAGPLGLYDTVEVRYNKSQIKLRPYHLRALAQLGLLEVPVFPSQVLAAGTGNFQDTTLQNWISGSFAVAVGTATYTGGFIIPFNILSTDEDRGLLPSMPGETGVQVILNTPTAVMGPDPLNVVKSGAGSTFAVNAGASTFAQVGLIYSDGEVYYQPTALPYDMGVLDGTIQMQIDAQLTSLQVGNTVVNRGKLNIVGKHYYVILLVIDGEQSTSCATWANIPYISSDKDDVGANSFWKYGTQTNMSFNEYLFWIRRTTGPYGGDLDEGVVPMIFGSIQGQVGVQKLDGRNFLDNSTNGWPAWHYGISLTAVTNANGITPRIEPFTVYVNPVGLVPVVGGM